MSTSQALPLPPVPARSRRSGGPRPVALVTGHQPRNRRGDRADAGGSSARVLVTGLPLTEERDPAIPDAYYESRVAGPEEVAGTIAWLCSDNSWLVTGNRIVLR